MMIHPATLTDVARLAGRLREADRQEVETASGLPAMAALARTFHFPGARVWLARDGQSIPFAAFGITPVEPTGGVVWLVGTDDLPSHALWTLRMARGFLQRWHEDHGILFNVVDARNTVHIRWLKLMGFAVNDTDPVLLNDFQFYPIIYDNPETTRLSQAGG